MAKKFEKGIMAMVMLGAVQAALRTFLGLGAAGMFGTAMKDQILGMVVVPVNDIVIVAPFLLLGLLGAAATIGLVLWKPWGYYSTLMVSVATIAYDIWATVAIQSSAAIGLLVPVLTLIFLTIRKERFVASWAVSA
jgi:hypothetical protein